MRIGGYLLVGALALGGCNNPAGQGETCSVDSDCISGCKCIDDKNGIGHCDCTGVDLAGYGLNLDLTVRLPPNSDLSCTSPSCESFTDLSMPPDMTAPAGPLRSTGNLLLDGLLEAIAGPLGDDQYAVAAGYDTGTADLIDLTTQKTVTTMPMAAMKPRAGAAAPFYSGFGPPGAVFILDSLDNEEAYVLATDNFSNLRLFNVIPGATLGAAPAGIVAIPGGNPMTSTNFAIAGFTDNTLHFITFNDGQFANVNPNAGSVVLSATRVYLFNLFATAARVYAVAQEPGTGSCTGCIGVYVVDAAKMTKLGAFTLPDTSKPRGIAVTPDDKTAYVADYAANVVHVLDLTASPIAETAKLTTGNGPVGVALSSDGTLLFVSNWSDNTLEVHSLPGGSIAQTLPTDQHPNYIRVYAGANAAKMLAVNCFDGKALDFFQQQ